MAQREQPGCLFPVEETRGNLDGLSFNSPGWVNLWRSFIFVLTNWYLTRMDREETENKPNGMSLRLYR